MQLIDGSDFLTVLRPLLEVGDPDALAYAVRTRWRLRELCGLLRHRDDDVRRVAAVVLGVVGDLSVTPALVRALRDPDPQVNQMADHALWSVWFRSGSEEAQKPFREGVALLGTEEYAKAVTLFGQAAQIDPAFAEAYNQCSIARYLDEDYERASDACCRAVALIPAHFFAIAQLGHCYSQLGQMQLALRCYRRALRINPRMPMIDKAIKRLETKVHDSVEPSLPDLAL